MGGSVAVIIVNWNSYDVTGQCLNSLRSIVYDSFEIIVVDNGSNDTSGQRLKNDFPEITLLRNEENLGFTGGNNLGIQYVLDRKFDYLMLLNNDTIVTTYFLRHLIEEIQSDELTAAIQPKIMYNYDRSVIWNAGGKYIPFFSLTKTIGEGKRDQKRFNVLKETDWITGCCFLIRVSVVKEIGLLDQKFFIYHEDADWSLKIRGIGMKMIYNPQSIIFHEAGVSDKTRDKHGEGNVSPFTHYQGVRNHLFMVRRYARGINVIGSWAYQVVKLSGYLMYFALRGRFVKLRYVAKGIYHGLTQ